MLKRLDDWPERLADYIKDARSKPLVWGTHDCVLFSLGVLEVLTGTIVTNPIRGTYTSALGAAKRMRELYRASNLTEAADVFKLQYGINEVPLRTAQRGDIVEADVALPDGNGTSPALGIVDLDGRFALFVGVDGLIRMRISDCRRAWKVG